MSRRKCPPRILWNGKDAPWLPSGYGVVGKHLLPRFADKYGPKNIVIYCPIYLRDEVRYWRRMKCLSGLSYDFGEDMIKSHYTNHNITFLLQVGDWCMLKTLPELASRDELLWVQWAPYDWLQIPDPIVQSTVRFAWRIVPWNTYGETKFRQHNLPNVTPYIPLGVDTRLWQALERSQFPKVMNGLGYREDTFNILIIGANQRRKYWAEQLLGISIFRKAFPEVSLRLYFHSHTHVGGEADLQQYCDLYELGDIVRWPDAYDMSQGGLKEEQLVSIMNCADVVLNCTLEGMGLVQLQAQACGIPVITLDEGPGFEIVKYGGGVPAMGVDYTQILTKPIPSPPDIAAALAEVYKWRGHRSLEAREHIVKNYDWDVVATKWFELIEELMEEREKYSLYVPKLSAMLKRRGRERIEVP